MKPTITSQSSRQQNFPLTDYNYQATLEASRATAPETPATYQLRGFRKLSADFFGTEAKVVYATELLLFGVITALSAWPVISMVVALGRSLRNY